MTKFSEAYKGHSIVTLCVQVARNNQNKQIFSSHIPKSKKDKKELQKWPGGGQEEVAYALLLEACRRESFVGFFLELSKDKDFIHKLKDLPEEERSQKLIELSEKLKLVLQNIIDGVAESVTQETFAILAHGDDGNK